MLETCAPKPWPENHVLYFATDIKLLDPVLAEPFFGIGLEIVIDRGERPNGPAKSACVTNAGAHLGPVFDHAKSTGFIIEHRVERARNNKVQIEKEAVTFQIMQRRFP